MSKASKAITLVLVGSTAALIGYGALSHNNPPVDTFGEGDLPAGDFGPDTQPTTGPAAGFAGTGRGSSSSHYHSTGFFSSGSSSGYRSTSYRSGATSSGSSGSSGSSRTYQGSGSSGTSSSSGSSHSSGTSRGGFGSSGHAASSSSS